MDRLLEKARSTTSGLFRFLGYLLSPSASRSDAIAIDSITLTSNQYKDREQGMKSIDSGGKTYCLMHLSTLQMQVSLELRGGFKKTVPLTVIFENHCYTRSLEEEEINSGLFPPHEIIEDGSKKDSRPRVFDLLRYDLSFNLPTLFQNLIHQQRRVYATSHHNVLSAQLTPVSSTSGTTVPYVFFIKVAKDKVNKKLLAHIESAYPYDANDPPFVQNKPQSLMTLLSKTWSD